MASKAAIVGPSSASAATPLVGLNVIVNRPPVNGLLSVCISSRSLDPKGTCVEVPSNLVPPGSGLPAVPLSAGTTGVDVAPQLFGGMIFGFQGQITFGTQVFRGGASGIAAVRTFSASMAIPPFALTGTSTTGTLSATCSGQWRGAISPNSKGLPVSDPAVSVLTCIGSVNGGPPGQATLLSVYRLTGENNAENFYSGVFAGS